jgi:hypothetical protein
MIPLLPISKSHSPFILILPSLYLNIIFIKAKFYSHYIQTLTSLHPNFILISSQLLLILPEFSVNTVVNYLLDCDV